MAIYFVEPQDLIKELGSTGHSCRGWPGISAEQRVALCEPVLDQLVKRFGLNGKTLMSVGAGTAHEETALLRCGMRRAFLFDIDENGTLEPLLRRIGKPHRKDAEIAYFVADFLAAPPSRNEIEPIDVLYFSGFTPDELRRGDISEQHRRERDSGRKPSSSLLRRGARVFSTTVRPDPDWPEGVGPLHDIVLKAMDDYLLGGGLFILQSYCAGVDVLRNPTYVKSWQRVLQRHGVDLIEAYYFRAAPAVTLWVGRKRRWRLQVRVIDFSRRPTITSFLAGAQLDDCSIARLI